MYNRIKVVYEFRLTIADNLLFRCTADILNNFNASI